jgi:ABC-type phosphate transport system substrate-binding protein
MTRFKSRFAAVVCSAILAAVPFASAQTAHIVGVGSSAQFLGSMIGISFLAAANLGSGQCQYHWTKKNAINAHDNRDTLGRIVDETNNVGILWEAACSDTTGNTNITDVWLIGQYDSTLGVRLFSAQQRPTSGTTAIPGATVYLTSTDGAGTTSDNLVLPNNLWADNKADVAMPANLASYIGTAAPGTLHVNMGLTDIRPEDALFATTRTKAVLNTTTYAGLGYQGPTAQIGAPIYTAQSGSTSNFTPIGFALSGGSDPIYTGGHDVPSYHTYPIGAAPIVFIYNNGGAGFDANVANLKSGVNGLGSAGGPYSLAHLFDGTTSCDTQNAAFGGADATATPITLFLREPLSGTMNTTEFSLFRTTGNTSDSQEKGVINPTRSPYNPLNLACTGNGSRQRRIGNGQVVSAVNSTANGMGYMFFSFANATTLIGSTNANQANYQYFTLDGVDPIGLPNNTLGYNTATQTLPYCGTNLCQASLWSGSVSYPNLRNGTYKAWSIYRWLIYDTDTDPLGPQGLLTSIQANIDTTVADFVPFSNGSDGLTVYRSHFSQSAKNCSYTVTTNDEELCNGTQSATESVTTPPGDSLGGTTEQGGDEGGLIIGWDYSTVTTAAKPTSGACDITGINKVTKASGTAGGRNFGFSATSSAHTAGYPVALETASVYIDGNPVTVSSCIAPTTSTLYVTGYTGTLGTGHKFSAYIAPTACGTTGCGNGVLGKKQ